MRDTKTFIVFEVTLTTATKNFLLSIFFAQIEEHVHDQLRVLIRVYVHFMFLISNCGLGRTILKIYFIFTVIIEKVSSLKTFHRVFAYVKLF